MGGYGGIVQGLPPLPGMPENPDTSSMVQDALKKLGMKLSTAGMPGMKPSPAGMGPLASQPGQQGMALPAPQLPQIGTPKGGAQPGQPPNMSNMPQPTVTQGSYGGPATQPKATPSGYETGFEFRTAGGRDMAITQGAMKNIGEAVGAYKQQKFQSESAQAEQVWQSYITLQKAAEQEQDPKKKQQIQDMSQQMLMDKKTQKILEKAQKDPMSGYAVGLQRAMQQSMATDQQKAQLELLAAQAKEKQEAAKKEQALATAATEVTPKLKAELGSKEEIARILSASREAIQEKKDVTATTIAAGKNTTNLQAVRIKADEDLKKAQIQAAARIKAAMIGVDKAHQGIALKIYAPAIQAQNEAVLAQRNATLAAAGDPAASQQLLATFMGSPGKVTQQMWTAAAKNQPLLDKIKTVWDGQNLVSAQIDQETANQLVGQIQSRADLKQSVADQEAQTAGLNVKPTTPTPSQPAPKDKTTVKPTTQKYSDDEIIRMINSMDYAEQK